MKRWIASLVLGALLAPTSLLACGDKFLVVGRGTRFEARPAAGRAPSVLVYAPPASPLLAALRGIPLERALRRAGWAPAYAATQRELEGFLGEGGADVVLAAEEDARLIHARAGASGPTVVPVLVDAAPSALAAARREWGVVLATPVSRSRLVDAVDEAVGRRSAMGEVASRGR